MMERMTKASSSTGSSSSGQQHIDAHQRQRERRLKNAPRLVNRPPTKPRPIDGNAGWSRFLAAYRSGRWDTCGRPVDRHEGDDGVTDADLAATTETMLNVRGPDGQPISGKDYYQTYGHLPAPQMPVRRRKFRHEALLRHGLISGAFRPQLQRYVELAKFLFDVELVSLSFASADERHIIFIAADGPPLTNVPQCASICSHALLLDGEDEVFVVPDTKQDWRFQELFGEGGFHTALQYRFHASAPIYLTSSETPCCNVSMAPVHAGRFSIFASKPRNNFDVDAGKRLLSLARMVEESMENEFLEVYATQVRQLQIDAAYITQSLDERVERRLKSQSSKQTAALAIASVSDSLAGSGPRRASADNGMSSSTMSSAATAAESVDATQPAADISILYDRLAMLPILEMMRQTLNATTVFMLDASNLRAANEISAVPVDVPMTNGKLVSVRAGSLTGRAMEKRLSMSSQSQSRSRPSSASSSASSSSGSSRMTFPITSETDASGISYDRFSPQKKSSSLWSAEYTPFKSAAMQASGSNNGAAAESSPSSPKTRDRGLHSESQPVVSVVASTGENSLLPDVEDVATISSLQAWFDSTSRQARHTTPQLFRRTTLDLSKEWIALPTDAAPSEGDSRRSSETLSSCPFEIHLDRSASGNKSCCCAEYVSKENDDLLETIMPMEAQTCLAVAIFGQTASQERVPLALVGVLWDTELPINTSKLEFCKTVGIHLSGVALREQTSKVQRGQMNFIRTMQHELRTPLNGIMGISEALCDTLDDSTVDGGDSAWSAAETNGNSAEQIATRDTPTTAAEAASSPTPKSTPISTTKPDKQPLTRMSTGRRATQSAAQTLAPQLESIHVSSMMLQTILDDILSLDIMFQESTSAAAMSGVGVNLAIQSEVINVASEVEDACREELRYFALQAMRTYRATSEATPMTPQEVQDTPTPSQGQPKESGGGMTLSPTADLQTANQDTATVMARPPTVLVRHDPSVNRAFRSDRIKLRKIVSKLVSNAIRYTSESGSVEVVVSPITPAEADRHAGQAQRQGVPPMSTGGVWSPSDETCTWIRILVSDTGIGMSEDFIEHKYLQPFLKADQFAQGIGLGATVACVMVQSLGGSFAVQSRIGQGTQVSICLPFGILGEDEIGGTPPVCVIKAPSLTASDDEICFRRAQFVGFDIDDGTKALHAFLNAHLRSKNVVVVEEKPQGGTPSEEPELLIVHESAVVGATMTALPSRLGQPNVHTIVVLCNASSLQSEVESVQLIKRGPHAHLRPPFGQDTLVKLDSLLHQFADANTGDVVSKDTHEAVAVDSGTLTPTGRPHKAEQGAATQPSEAPGDYFSLGQTTADTSGSAAVANDEAGDATMSKRSPMSSNVSEASNSSTPNESTSPATAKQQMTASQALVQASVDSTSEATADRFRVLVVEDNPINMRLITSVLRKTGFKYVEAHDGVEAVAQYKAFEPSVVLLDISLPLMDGFQACVAMRAHTLSFRPKIIAITALSTNEDKVRGLNVCGMDAWHTKPISIKMLRTNLVTWKSEWDASRNRAVKAAQTGSAAASALGTPTSGSSPSEQMELTLPNGAASLPPSSASPKDVEV